MLTSKQTPQRRLHEQGQWLSQAQLFQSKRGHVSRLFKSDNTPKRDLIDMPPDHTRVDFIIKKQILFLNSNLTIQQGHPQSLDWLKQLG